MKLHENFYIKLRDSMWLNFVTLKIFGYWPPEEHETSKFYSLYRIFPLVFAFYIAITTEIINIIFLRFDIKMITDALFLMLTHWAQLFKLTHFFIKRKTVLKILEMLESELFQPRNHKQKKMIEGFMYTSSRYNIYK